MCTCTCIHICTCVWIIDTNRYMSAYISFRLVHNVYGVIWYYVKMPLYIVQCSSIWHVGEGYGMIWYGLILSSVKYCNTLDCKLITSQHEIVLHVFNRDALPSEHIRPWHAMPYQNISNHNIQCSNSCTRQSSVCSIQCVVDGASYISYRKSRAIHIIQYT